jgi:hypothetical protein
MRYLSGIVATALLAASGGTQDRQAGDSAGGAAATSIEPGEWEMTTTIIRMSVPEPAADLPVPPPHTARICITPEQAASPARDLTGRLDGCTGQNHWGADGRIEISLRCPTPQGAVQVRIAGRHSAASVELDQKVITHWEGSALEMDARITGRRIGGCRASAVGGELLNSH